MEFFLFFVKWLNMKVAQVLEINENVYPTREKKRDIIKQIMH